MSSNFLEQVVAECYEYKAILFAEMNLFKRRAKGGYECELDIVAFHPEKKHLIHIKPTTDSSSWENREKIHRNKLKDILCFPP
jgi:hypothetical protein